MDEPFYYLRAEDRVPRDAVHVIVGGAVTVVAPGTFEGFPNLARVELQEGVEVIGVAAFRDCPNLLRVDCPSSLRTIADFAFASCERLSELTLREGVEEIGMRVFCGCDLRRITVPSSVVGIGVGAFALCPRLAEVTLKEGLRRIGNRAFHSCGLESITVPSSVVEIGGYAFAYCDNLGAATLAGGMVMVARGAFNCPRLGRIGISSVAIVVEAGEDGNGSVAAATGGIERDRMNESSYLVLFSPHLGSMSPEELRNLTGEIDGIAGAARGAGPLDLAVGDVSAQIRDRFVDHLSTWYVRYKREVATVLELGLWKIQLVRARRALMGRAAGGGKRARAGPPTRDDARRTCGADPIVGLVLSALAGPHRRVDRAEDAGSIQP